MNITKFTFLFVLYLLHKYYTSFFRFRILIGIYVLQLVLFNTTIIHKINDSINNNIFKYTYAKI